MVSLESRISQVGGVATRAQLSRAYVTNRDITRAVVERRIIRVRQARYVLPDTPPERVLAARYGGLLAGATALRTYNLWAGFEHTTHIVVPTNASRRPAAHGRVRLHWANEGRTPEPDRECWRVGIWTALRQTVAWSDRQTGLAALDMAVSRFGWPRVRAAFANEPSASRALVLQARTGCDSGVESIVGRRLENSGLRVERQIQISGVGRVDMRIERVIVEVDGRGYHEDPQAFENDRRRDAELVALGYVVIRLTYERIRLDWEWCQRMVLAALAGRRG